MEKKMGKSNDVSELFRELMKNDDFVEEILNTEDGVDLVQKFHSHGIDLSQIDFSELCKILSQKIQINSQTYEVDSLINSIVPDYKKSFEKTVVNFKEQLEKS